MMRERAVYASEAKKSDFLVHLDRFSNKIFHFIADSLLKDAVFMLGVNLRLCLLSLCYSLKPFEVKCNHLFLAKFAILFFFLITKIGKCEKKNVSYQPYWM